jgi:hypothetical protein
VPLPPGECPCGERTLTLPDSTTTFYAEIALFVSLPFTEISVDTFSNVWTVSSTTPISASSLQTLHCTWLC